VERCSLDHQEGLPGRVAGKFSSCVSRINIRVFTHSFWKKHYGASY
jgi:hypothetical protein